MTEITSVQAYREKLNLTFDAKLPSGAVFKLKRLTPMDYIQEGLTDLPNEFFKFIMEVNEAKIPDDSSPEAKKNYELFEKFLKVSIEKGIVDPPMILKYEKEKVSTHLIFGELTLEDQTYIIHVVTGKIIPQSND